MPTASVIILHWNTPELLKKQLQELIVDKTLQIIVVDNASVNKPNWIRHDFPSVEVIQNSTNQGFARGVNQGFLHAKSDWVLILNPDVSITPAAIFLIIKEAQKSHFDACAPKPQSKNYARPIPTSLSLLAEFTPLKYLIRESFFGAHTLTGGALFIKRSVFEKLGGFDERFFLWFEDSDITQRLTTGGYNIGWINLFIEHKGGASFERIDEQIRRDIFFHSMDVYADKHFSPYGKLITRLLRRKYSNGKLLPILNGQVFLTVPNMKKELLERFLEKNYEKKSADEEWVVVTSAIGESAVWSWRKKYPSIRFIPIEKNRGFAHTVNIGFRVAIGEWVGTVNDDVLLSDEWIRKLTERQSDKIGSVNPVIKKGDGSIESAGIRISLMGKADPMKKFEGNIVDATNAACVLYRRKALDTVGLFDERFGSYLEDIDLSLRLTRNGYRNEVVEGVIVIHEGQQTSKSLGSKKNLMDLKNWWLVILKNWSVHDIVLNFPSIIIERLRNISGLIKSLL